MWRWSGLLATTPAASHPPRNSSDAEQSQSFACIITDIQMPGMSGIELKQHLTASQCPVPVIMITARHDPGLEEKAIASGAACFLRKPFEADALIRCLESALKP